MRVREHIPLAPLTTLRVGGLASRMVEVDSEDDLAAVVGDADARGETVLVLGGGSNVVVADGGFPGTVVRVSMRGIESRREGSRIAVDVAAGENWDTFVARAVDEEWSGVECMSGIPGLVGATPVQNVGAYGQEVSDTLVSVRVYDRRAQAFEMLPAAACGFSYRASVFKRNERWIVTGVRFVFELNREGGPIRYAELARELSARIGQRAPSGLVRKAVVELRRAKGMVLDALDPESVSAGSFFVNPIVSGEMVEAVSLAAGERPPTFPEAGERYKVAAAWLVERAGFPKGWALGRAGVSRKHALALVNRGGATARELLAAASAIRRGVRDRFGILLEPEPVLVGCSLEDDA